MKLFVGLGNPGASYARQRHDLGYMAADAIAAAHGFGPWREKFRGQVAEGRLGTERVLLLKPGTYMNLSGELVRAALQFFKLEPGDVWCSTTSSTLPPARCGSRPAAARRPQRPALARRPHRPRLRAGADRHRPSGRQAPVQQLRARRLRQGGRRWVEPLVAAMADAAPRLAAGDAAGFMNAVALRPRRRPNPRPPPRPGGPPGPRTQPDPRSPLQRLVDRFR